MSPRDVADAVIRLLEGMEDHQRTRMLAAARSLLPRLTEDDLKNPDDYPALHADPRFNYEDGVLAGVRMSAAAVRALLVELAPPDPPSRGD